MHNAEGPRVLVWNHRQIHPAGGRLRAHLQVCCGRTAKLVALSLKDVPLRQLVEQRQGEVSPSVAGTTSAEPRLVSLAQGSTLASL